MKFPKMYAEDGAKYFAVINGEAWGFRDYEKALDYCVWAWKQGIKAHVRMVA